MLLADASWMVYFLLFFSLPGSGYLGLSVELTA